MAELKQWLHDMRYKPSVRANQWTCAAAVALLLTCLCCCPLPGQVFVCRATKPSGAAHAAVAVPSHVRMACALSTTPLANASHRAQREAAQPNHPHTQRGGIVRRVSALSCLHPHPEASCLVQEMAAAVSEAAELRAKRTELMGVVAQVETELTELMAEVCGHESHGLLAQQSLDDVLARRQLLVGYRYARCTVCVVADCVRACLYSPLAVHGCA